MIISAGGRTEPILGYEFIFEHSPNLMHRVSGRPCAGVEFKFLIDLSCGTLTTDFFLEELRDYFFGRSVNGLHKKRWKSSLHH